jgi:hypothetical protein
MEENQYRRLIKKGCAWLDRRAKKLNSSSFVYLGEGDRESVMTIAMESDSGSLQKIFFQQMRSDAFRYYYGHPKSWRQIGYGGPPQPNGFPDYDKSPSLPS